MSAKSRAVAVLLTVLLGLTGLTLTGPAAAADQFQAQTATTTTLSASPSAVQEGGAVTVTATVRTAAGQPVTSGSVRFTSGGIHECNSVTSQVDSTGVATGTVKLVSLVDPYVDAVYEGNGVNAPSEASLEVPVTVVTLPTVIDFTATMLGRVSLEPEAAGASHWNCFYYDQDLEGDVDLFEANQLLGTGRGSNYGFSRPVEVDLSPGTHQIRAVLRPDALYAPSGAIGWTGSSTTKLVTVSGGTVTTTADLVRNGSFETDTAMWSGVNGTVTRAAVAKAPQGAAVAKVTRTAGSSYSVTDTFGGSGPTVVTTTAGADYVALASVAAGGSSTVGMPITLVLRERTPAGALVKETKVKSKLASGWKQLAVQARATKAGNTLGITVEQSNAASGHSFQVDAVSLRHASRMLGTPGFALTNYTNGTVWTGLTANAKRVSQLEVASPLAVTSMSAYMDGLGATSGSQVLKGVVYTDAGGAPGTLVAKTGQATVKAGAAGTNVELRFGAPVLLKSGRYWVGLHSGLTGGVARYLAMDQAGALRTNLDTYSDGPVKTFGTASAGDKRMVLHLFGG